MTLKSISRLSEGRIALFLVLPTLIILIGLAIFPLGWAGALAFRVENLFRPDIGRWVGLRNFKYLLTEDTFWKSIRLTHVWCLCVVSIQMALGFLFAMMLDTRARIVGVLRTLIVIPVFISPIAMGLTWQFMFEPVTGVINYILDSSDFDSTQLSLADLNVDGAINIQDVILLINLILEN